MRPIATCLLKNGSKAPLPVVRTTIVSLKTLAGNGDPVKITAVRDLRKLADDNNYNVSKESLECLQRLHLVQDDGRIHETVKDIVQSSITFLTFEDCQMPIIGDPIAIELGESKL